MHKAKPLSCHSIAGTPMSPSFIRSNERYAWHGQSVLLTNERGECGDDNSLSGYYFREARYLRTLKLEINGFGPDPFGGTRAGFSASGEINRNDFGVSYNGPIPGATGGVIVSEKVAITIEIEGVLDKSE